MWLCPACHAMSTLSPAACESGWMQHVDHGGDRWPFRWPTFNSSPAAESACSTISSFLVKDKCWATKEWYVTTDQSMCVIGFKGIMSNDHLLAIIFNNLHMNDMRWCPNCNSRCLQGATLAAMCKFVIFPSSCRAHERVE